VMMKSKQVNGFSKLSKEEKIKWLQNVYLHNPSDDTSQFSNFWHADSQLQNKIDGFSENTISNFILPYGIAPNFLIDGNVYAVPMVIEESSVVAAAALGAKFWSERGGFTTTILGTTKVGHVHFEWSGTYAELVDFIPDLEFHLLASVSGIVENMQKRGGGIQKMEFLDFSFCSPNLYQCRVHFQTCDSMGANFINTVLEKFAEVIENYFVDHPELPDEKRDADIVMSILSNYTPECLVRAEVCTSVDNLGNASNGMLAHAIAEKFHLAVKIARHDVYRATTHNKGIFNGVDAVVLATGNDFRAVEAAGHAYASRDGQYRGLSFCDLSDGIFRFWIDLPLAIGTVGGLTSLHPLAKKSLEILGNPDSETLMRIIASVGLAQNFSAVKSLVTTGIQQGHMKMHLMNILSSLGAGTEVSKKAVAHFENNMVSYSAVREFLQNENSGVLQ
jgi:hydroxymethylglutaryl-CoA reductase